MQQYLKAAEQGHAMAQYSLGSMFYFGQGIPKDDINAYAWLGIAAAGGFEPAQNYRDVIASQISPEELEQAQILARELWGKYGNKELAGR